MAEVSREAKTRKISVRHRARGAQILIYFGKLLRMFVYQNDWKVLPMAALIAGLVGMVIRRKFCINMEGTLMGSFALVCVAIWNGCFNSIQVICRERDVIKREHRSGMHISSYVVAHMMYQALLCLAQTMVTIYVTMMIGVKYPSAAVITGNFVVDFGISLFLITYASDMLSLWVSALAHNTTTAMTIMPFILIFQLVFSGGMLSLPAWTEPLTHFTISNPGLKVVASQADMNHQPYATVSTLINSMKEAEIEESFTGEQLMRGVEAAGLLDKYKDVRITENSATVGEVWEKVLNEPGMREILQKPVPVHATVGKVIEFIGEEKVRSFLEEKAAAVNYKPEYENTRENILTYWFHLLLFVAVFALLAMITLEFIDKDKR